MSEQQRIDAPARLVEQLRPVQERIDRMAAEVQAALFGARLALNVPDGWEFDGAGWVAPDKNALSDGEGRE